MTAPARNASIISAHFSGSTLLSILLGNHPDAESIGELNMLFRYDRDRRRCTCGQPVHVCPLWSNVLGAFRAQRQTPEPDLFIDTARLATAAGSRYIAQLCQLAAVATPSRLHQLTFRCLGPGGRVLRDAADDLVALMDLVRRASGRQIIVDSSKGALTARLSFLADPTAFRAIYLVRDARAVAESWMRKSGVPAQHAARNWLVAYRSQSLCFRRLPASHRLFLRYEDLCADPAAELARICSFLQIPYHDSMLDLATREIHNIAGNPMRLDGRRQAIRLDDGWRERLGKDQRATLEQMLGTANRKLGYS